METTYSLCPNCDACPEVFIGPDHVLIGEAGNQVRLSHDEWNVLVAAIKDQRLTAVETSTTDSTTEGTCQCCGSAS